MTFCRLIAAFWVVTALGCSHGATGRRANWVVVETEHVRLHTPVGRGYAERTARVLEARYRNIVDHTFPCARGRLQGKVEVVLLDDRDFERLAPPDLVNSGGYYATRASALLATRGRVVMPASQGQHWLRAFQHELGHHLAATCHPDQPAWLAEGLASYVETITQRRGELVLGTPAYLVVPSGPARTMQVGGVNVAGVPRATLPSVATLLATPPEDFYGERAADYYPAAAILVRALEFSEGETQKRYQRYLASLARGQDAEQALQQAFGPGDLQALFDAAVEQQRFGVFAAPLASGPIDTASATPLTPSEAHALRAWLWGFSAPAHRNEAAREVREGLALDPDDAPLQVLSLQLLISGDRVDEARKQAEAWWAQQPESIDAARAALEIALHGGESGSTERRATLRSLSTALESSTESVDMDRRARAAIALGEPSLARAITESALQRDERCASCWLTRARIQAAEQAWNVAFLSLRRALMLAAESDPALWSRARRLRDEWSARSEHTQAASAESAPPDEQHE